ncbi:MAG TPA: hypothetical protein VG796_15040 [Verrucomicrobiales bacterium]|nr:hypothetical protein [Verrucomicrobiales bacterium]
MKTPLCSIAPLLSVRKGALAVEFYKSAFGAVELFRVEDPGGDVVARLSVEGAEFWVSDESPSHGNFSPESLGGGTVRMIMTVENPDTPSTVQSPQEPPKCGPSTRNMAGASVASSIRSDIIGKSESRL